MERDTLSIQISIGDKFLKYTRRSFKKSSSHMFFCINIVIIHCAHNNDSLLRSDAHWSTIMTLLGVTRGKYGVSLRNNFLNIGFNTSVLFVEPREALSKRFTRKYKGLSTTCSMNILAAHWPKNTPIFATLMEVIFF